MAMADSGHWVHRILVAHRPYGMDCKCGWPINSDEDWARHVSQIIAARENTLGADRV